MIMSKHLNRACLPKRAFSSDEVESVYGVPKGTLANLRCRREGAVFFKVGGKVYYRVDEFEKWFFSNRVLTKDAVSSRMGG